MKLIKLISISVFVFFSCALISFGADNYGSLKLSGNSEAAPGDNAIIYLKTDISGELDVQGVQIDFSYSENFPQSDLKITDNTTGWTSVGMTKSNLLGVGNVINNSSSITGVMEVHIPETAQIGTKYVLNIDNAVVATADNEINMNISDNEWIIEVKNQDKPSVSNSSGGGGSKSTSLLISFETNGGSKISEKKVIKNNILVQPENPKKDGYTFDGWYVDKACSAKYNFSEKVTSNMILYAKWSKNIQSDIVLTIDSKLATVNGEIVENDVAPKIVNDRTMLPIRFIAENLGASVEWDEKTQTVAIRIDGMVIYVEVGSIYAYVNVEQRELDSPAFIENDRTYMPVRFISENLGASVEWNEQNKSIRITK